MNSPYKILVYSQKNLDYFKRWSLLNNAHNLDCCYVYNLEDLYSSLVEEEYDLLIADFDDSYSYSALLDIITQVGNKRLPMVVTNLQTEVQRKEKDIAEIGFPFRKKLVLRKTQSTPSRSDRDKLHVISQTAATLGHEINNPLMTIAANVEMILKNYGFLQDNLIKRIRLIGKAADRIREATEKLAGLESLNYRDTAAGKMIDLEETFSHAGSGFPETVHKSLE